MKKADHQLEIGTVVDLVSKLKKGFPGRDVSIHVHADSWESNTYWVYVEKTDYSTHLPGPWQQVEEYVFNIIETHEILFRRFADGKKNPIGARG